MSLSDERKQPLSVTVLWWVATIATLVVLDDLVTGPLFWALAYVSKPLAMGVAFTVYWVGQLLLVRSATGPDIGRVASYLLNRLQLSESADAGRSNRNIAANETAIRSQITGPAIALLISPLVGGVIPPLLLHKRGLPVTGTRRLAVFTALIYAAEYTLLHAYLPGRLFGN